MWFFQMLKHIIISESNKFRYETAKHLTLAFFYGASSMYSNKNKIDNLGKDRHDNLTDEFLNLVKKNYKQQRAMQFYADKLCISPKYLSSIIKSKTGVAANEWIDRHVILEAKALLKSTNMTISQISDYLEFPSQSFYGKYFKRVTGISPREYQKHKI